MSAGRRHVAHTYPTITKKRSFYDSVFDGAPYVPVHSAVKELIYVALNGGGYSPKIKSYFGILTMEHAEIITAIIRQERVPIKFWDDNYQNGPAITKMVLFHYPQCSLEFKTIQDYLPVSDEDPARRQSPVDSVLYKFIAEISDNRQDIVR